MTPYEFWHSTPREFEAHAALIDSRDSIAANLLAALHNGPLTRKDRQLWTADMFMPGYEPEQADPLMGAVKAQMDFELLRARMHKPTAKEQEMQLAIAHRMARARQASDEGATGEVIQNIMKGLL
jgi:hypothetical protein